MKAEGTLCMHQNINLLAVRQVKWYIDGFQMSIKRPTSGGQARALEAAV